MDDIIITKEMIVSQLQKDAEHLDDMSVQRLIKSYITKIYAHGDSVNITGGVNLNYCGGTECPLFTLYPCVEKGHRGFLLHPPHVLSM